MGASNFHRSQTSKVYAVLMDTEETFKECTECGHKHYDFEYSAESYKQLTKCSECNSDNLTEETEYRSCESYEYDDFKEYLRETAERKVKETVFVYRDESGSDNDRNYCATDLFSIRSSKMYGDIEISVKVIGQIVSAYYEGASLDFSVEFNDEEYTNDKPDFEWLFEYQSEMNKGLQVLQNRKAIIWAEKETEKIKNLIEEIFTEVSQPLNVVGTFSNGETIYELTK